MNAKNLIHAMLIENTGRHFLDSGGAYGRHWEKNQAETVESLSGKPSASLEVYQWEKDGKVFYDFSPTISLFHHLTQVLETDSLCDEFNALPVADWDSGKFYGVSTEGEEWLENQGFTVEGDSFNSYNWSANFTQTIQGDFLKFDGESYVLLQIHGGCDVRGGYTNARLFKISTGETYSLFSEDCSFSVELPTGETFSLSWYGEWINEEGTSASEEDFERFASALNLSEDNRSALVEGDHHAYC